MFSKIAKGAFSNGKQLVRRQSSGGLAQSSMESGPSRHYMTQGVTLATLASGGIIAYSYFHPHQPEETRHD
ncbi:unnamed protein product, partial [Mesorhabditis spiculigera]